MFAALVFPLCLAVAWVVAYYAFVRHWLMQYAVVASVIARMEAAESDTLAKIKIWAEGKTAAMLAGVTSLIGAAASAIEGLEPSDLDAIKDQGLWHGILNNGAIELKIMSILAFVTALLTIKSHLAAAKIVPATPAVAPTPR